MPFVWVKKDKRLFDCFLSAGKESTLNFLIGNHNWKAASMGISRFEICARVTPEGSIP